MVKTKTIYVETKRSKNFQTYTVGKSIEIEDGDDVDTVTIEAQTWCRKKCQSQIAIDTL